MGRMRAGGMAALLLMAGGLFWWSSRASQAPLPQLATAPPPPVAGASSPPRADPATADASAIGTTDWTSTNSRQPTVSDLFKPCPAATKTRRGTSPRTRDRRARYRAEPPRTPRLSSPSRSRRAATPLKRARRGRHGSFPWPRSGRRWRPRCPGRPHESCHGRCRTALGPAPRTRRVAVSPDGFRAPTVRRIRALHANAVEL